MKIRQYLSNGWLRAHIPLLAVVVSFGIIGGVTTWLTHADSSNVSVNFSSTVAVLPPYPIGTDISTYGSGLVTAPKQGAELANLGVTFMKVPIQWNNGNPVSSAGGHPNQNISGAQWIKAIESTGATPEIVMGGPNTDNDFTASDAANLVSYFTNTNNGFPKPVLYYAIGNEPNGAGLSVSSYCTLFNAAASAMKAANPTIKIDGPTFSYYNQSSMQQFLNCAGSNVDILDFHAYGTGGPNPKSDSTLLSETNLDGQYLSQLRQMINATDASRASQIQMQVGELNLAWEYPDGYAGWNNNGDTRFFDPFNTVWSAATIGSVLESGGRAMQYGDQNGALSLTFDGTYNSIVNAHYASQHVNVSTYDPMPIYYGMGMFTGFSGSNSSSTVQFRGFGTNSVSATSSIPNVDVFASSNSDNIVLVNKNPSTSETAAINLNGFGGGTADVWQTNNANPYTYPTKIAAGENVSNSISVNLPAYSVTTIVLNGGGSTTTTPNPPVISSVSSSTPSTSGTTIKWATDQTSTSQVQYGTTTAYGSNTTEDTGMVTSHSVTLTGLSAGTTYHYRVISVNGNNLTTASGDGTFTTAAASGTPTPPTPPPSTALAVPFRINVGGATYKDSAGNAWLADTDSTGGATDNQAAGKTITGTSDQTIYQDERHGTSFSYQLPVANGTYKLQLDFAEINAGCVKAGCRVFNVAVNGTPWLNNFDIAAKVGAYKALNESENVTVTNGQITIALTGVTSDAQLAGIEVTIPPTTNPTPPPTAVATGAIVGIASKCLDDQYAKFLNGNTIWLYVCNGTNAQKWTIPGDGTIRLDNNQYCLDVKNAGTVPGTPVWLYSCNGTVAQQWVINSNGSISNPHSGLCLDDKHSGTANGNPIWLYTCNGTGAQKWTVPVGTGTSNGGGSGTGSGGGSGSGGGGSGGGTVGSGSGPDGVPGKWTLAFDDEFTKDSSLNQSVWSQTSGAEGECGQGNHGNDQAEWNQAYANDTVNSTDGLVITDKRQTVNQCNDTFSWTGGLISSKQSFTAGDVIEEKFQVPANVPVGGWDSFWTWCANGSNGCEVDVYELYPPNSFGNGTGPSTDHVGGGSTGSVMNYISLGTWHTMDAVINSNSVTWYLDGKNVGSANNSSSEGAFNLILDNDVCNNNGCPGPAASTNQITENVSYVRVWKP